MVRIVLAVLAGGLAGMGGAYLLNANADKLPDSVKAGDFKSALFASVVVAVPAVIAYGLVAGVRHNAVGLPAKA
jgi:hypothetical protein